MSPSAIASTKRVRAQAGLQGGHALETKLNEARLDDLDIWIRTRAMQRRAPREQITRWVLLHIVEKVVPLAAAK